jgi:hypothetical protein
MDREKQRLEALDKANAIRCGKAQVKRELHDGKRNLIKTLTLPPASIRGAPLREILEAAPQIGKRKAGVILRRARLRFDLRNGVALCWSDHRWAEEHPIEFALWFQQHRRADVIYLAQQRRRGVLKRNLSDYLELEQQLLAMKEKR